MPWYRDLELERHGAKYLQPELNVAMVCRDGQTLEWWSDFEKTAASFRQFSKKDASALRRWRDRFRPIVENILIPESQAPPLPRDERQRVLEQTGDGQLLSPIDLASMSKWDEYTQAREDMFDRTHTKTAPWTVIRSNDKRRARLNAMRHILASIDYSEKDKNIVAKPDPEILGSEGDIFKEA